jgi:signal transduction histidine kinase
MSESSAATPDVTARASLALLIEEARPEILEEWIELLAWQGLPHQRRAADERPAGLYADFSHILDVILTWLHAVDAEVEAHARSEVRALYRGYGWRWAQRAEAGPDLVADPPRITQAVWRVLLRYSATDLSPAEILNCAVTLNALAMDLAMARVSGYLSAKETVLASQGETLSRLMDELTRVEMRQRQALALELHDNLAQRLASLFNGIQRCGHVIERDVQAAKGELQHLRQVASEALRDARTMIRDLHFGVSSQEGGLSALVDYLADLDEDTGIHHEARIPASLPSLPPTQESLILRVIQEALRNAHKHAQATRIVVAAATSPDGLTVEICDDGPGFDLDEALTRSQRRGRLGLIGMRERADLLGASLAIESAPGAGTTIRLTVPLTEKGPPQP